MLVSQGCYRNSTPSPTLGILQQQKYILSQYEEQEFETDTLESVPSGTTCAMPLPASGSLVGAAVLDVT